MNWYANPNFTYFNFLNLYISPVHKLYAIILKFWNVFSLLSELWWPITDWTRKDSNLSLVYVLFACNFYDILISERLAGIKAICYLAWCTSWWQNYNMILLNNLVFPVMPDRSLTLNNYAKEKKRFALFCLIQNNTKITHFYLPNRSWSLLKSSRNIVLFWSV